jgi:hypothetical protein
LTASGVLHTCGEEEEEEEEEEEAEEEEEEEEKVEGWMVRGLLTK